ncbi:MAG: aspartate-semialdehyde dehydrogenase [Deltaproteobacteria bacterium]|nr:aspartate-semialdehyde dehydrogenase [Deltaproteobacteria bacterium]
MGEKTYSVAVAGATGAVGLEMIKVLQQRRFPVGSLRLLASERSEGKELTFEGRSLKVERLTPDSFWGVQIALFSAGAARSLEFAPAAAAAGAVVVDNSSAFRMDPHVPLVVPEVNPQAIAGYRNRGIIANPNCSTIQMVLVLKPLHDAARIRRVVVSTYQAVSGTGLKAIDELLSQTRAILNSDSPPVASKVYPHQIAFNCLHQIDSFLENGYTKEEMKMVNETQKIMEDPSIRVTATTVRVPVLHSHSEAVNIETEKKLTAREVREILSRAPGVAVVDDPTRGSYPLAIHAAGRDESFVGRIREDESIPRGINLWIVSDNIRKGAALNAVQIAEVLVQKYLG